MNEFLKNNIVTESPNWLMTSAERCAIIGLISRLEPTHTLEIGYRFGGCTGFLAEFSKQVSSVDLDANVLNAGNHWTNAKGYHENSVDFLKRAIEEGRRFDFAVIDGDHSTHGAAQDVKLAIQCCDVIVLHDSMNPECRQGYLNGLKDFGGYYNLDFVLNSGIWGGLGIIITN